MQPSVIFGEALFDRFGPEERIGGAPFNVASHLQGLGLHPLLVTRLGQDGPGAVVRARMEAWGMALWGVQEHPVLPTGMVLVEETADGHRFRILPHQAYDAIDAQTAAQAAGAEIGLLYYGTLALREKASRQAWECLAGRARRCFVDINLRAPWWRAETVEAAIGAAQILKLNQEELAVLRKVFRLRADGDRQVVEALVRRFALDEVILTRGANGAAQWAGGTWLETPAPPVAVRDTVGAGDAFAAAWLFGLSRAWAPPTCLVRAQALAAAICGLQGALPDDREFYRPFLNAWDGA